MSFGTARWTKIAFVELSVPTDIFLMIIISARDATFAVTMSARLKDVKDAKTLE